MLSQQDAIATQIYTILVETLQQVDFPFDQNLDLSSIQVLKALALVEKTFQIEVEDEEVFHGIFGSAERLSAYVRTKLEEA